MLQSRITFLCAAVAATAAISMGAGGAHADTLGEHHTFFTESSYDIQSRTSVAATLVAVSTHAYIYLDDSFQPSGVSASALSQKITALANEFDTNIYPKETTFWGSEPNPGIDNDSHVTILLEQLQSQEGGYFNTGNEYATNLVPTSNQREMVIVSAESLFDPTNDIDGYLSHEMQHLIDFNQKDVLNHTDEDTWLNELRSQYAITVAGYNTPFQGSDLAARAKDFFAAPDDSLTEWPGTALDYAEATLFGEYLVEQYGPNILSDTLHSPLTGIASINDWLASHHYSERFDDVYTDWVMATLVNNTSVDPRLGYSQPNLATFQVTPDQYTIIAYPTPTAIQYLLKPWEFQYTHIVLPTLPSGTHLQISWSDSRFSVGYVDVNQKIQMLTSPAIIDPTGITNFVLVPVNMSKTTGFTASETAIPLSLAISYTTAPVPPVVQKLTDGSLIGHNGDVYLIMGAYKRYLSPTAMKLFVNSPVITVDDTTFNSYTTTNYIRADGDPKVYALWPDGTRHWLHMTAQHFSASGRDWNSVFVISPDEMKLYTTGPDITN